MTHTPGPWRWEVNERCKQVNLCGGGGQPFDLTVMDLRRWGMSGSKMRFRDPALDGMNLMHPIEHWLATVPGREHHKTWFQTINHPDARLIAAAPELLEALKEVIKVSDRATVEFDAARAAIAKAEGRS